VDKAGVIYNLPKSLGDKGGHLCAIERLGLERPWHVMVEARSLHVIVSSDHPSADEQVAEAIARVVSRYAVDLTPEIEVNVPQAGINVSYVAKAVMRFSSHLRG
jgi:hypothetical protein